MHEGAEGGHANLRALHQPNITVDARAFVKPPFFQGGVGAYADKVLAAVVHVFGHVVHLGGVAARLAAHVEPIEPHAGVAENTIEPQADVLAKVGGRDIHLFPVPTHTGSWITVTHGLVTMRMTGQRVVAQGGHPVVGHIDVLPTAVVELHHIGTFVVDGVGLGQVVEVLGAATEIFHWVGGIAEGELPTVTQGDALTHIA